MGGLRYGRIGFHRRLHRLSVCGVFDCVTYAPMDFAVRGGTIYV